MVPSLADLHPNPGWVNTTLTANSSAYSSSHSGANADAVGKHCILELYHCRADRLDDEAFLRSSITQAVQQAGATLLQLISHRFSPQGVTALALLAESHLSIHTWPESGYAAVDVFTCGDHTMPERACRRLIADLEATDHRLSSFRRQTPQALGDQQRLPH
jgi:S-adenosylmethionine decarboxylase